MSDPTDGMSPAIKADIEAMAKEVERLNTKAKSIAEGLRDKLIAQAVGLELQAEACEAVAAHFRPRYAACFLPIPQTKEQAEEAWRLYPHVIDNERAAKNYRREAKELRDAAALFDFLQQKAREQ